MALENLERDNNMSEEELKRLKTSSLQIYAGPTPLTLHTSFVYIDLGIAGADTVCALDFRFFVSYG